MKETNERINLLLKRMKLRREMIARLKQEIDQRAKEVEKHLREIIQDSQEVHRLYGQCPNKEAIKDCLSKEVIVNENKQHKLTMKDVCLPEVYARSFPEHEQEDPENGCYGNVCRECNQEFLAHKHYRGACKECVIRRELRIESSKNDKSDKNPLLDEEFQKFQKDFCSLKKTTKKWGNP